jgi:hypothetical protein
MSADPQGCVSEIIRLRSIKNASAEHFARSINPKTVYYRAVCSFLTSSHGIVIKHLIVFYLLFAVRQQTPIMGAVLSFVTGFVAPVFIIISPITSYADQIAAIYRSKSSAGFSLDIPLIMLVASILRYVLLGGQTHPWPLFQDRWMHMLTLIQRVLLSWSAI